MFKLLDSATVRDVVYIFNGDETQLITTIIAIHAQRLQITDKTEFSFYDSPAGGPTAFTLGSIRATNTGFLFGRLNEPPGHWRQQGRHRSGRINTRPQQDLLLVGLTKPGVLCRGRVAMPAAPHTIRGRGVKHTLFPAALRLYMEICFLIKKVIVQTAKNRRNRRSCSETSNVGEMRVVPGDPIMTPRCARVADS